MKIYDRKERQTIPMKEFIKAKHNTDNFEDFFRLTEIRDGVPQCPPSVIFNNINKAHCFHCVECKQKFYKSIKENKKKKIYKIGKEEFKYEDLES